jgi:hypothetical protein
VLLREKNRCQKISCYSPFKLLKLNYWKVFFGFHARCCFLFFFLLLVLFLLLVYYSTFSIFNYLLFCLCCLLILSVFNSSSCCFFRMLILKFYFILNSLSLFITAGICFGSHTFSSICFCLLPNSYLPVLCFVQKRPSTVSSFIYLALFITFVPLFCFLQGL